MFEELWKYFFYFQKMRSYPGFYKTYKDLVAEDGLSVDRWCEKRAERVARLLNYACKNVPYYKKMVGHIQLTENAILAADDLINFPILTKSLVRDNLGDLLTVHACKNKIFKNTTGGSTGVPLKFYQDLGYRTVANALQFFVRKWWGVLPYDKTASIWGADIDFKDLSFKERISSHFHRTKSLNAFRMDEMRLRRFCEELYKWKPPYLMGYSSALEAMANCAKKNGIRLQFKAIRSTAETLWPHQRALFEEVFQSPVYNFYGSREVNNLAAECPEGKLHLISTWRFVEIVDMHGNVLPEGEAGNIAVTDCSNFSMPFIRYLNGDYGRLSNEPCSCGRSSPVIEKLLGRSSDLIRTKEGRIIHGEFFTHLFYGAEEVLQFQVHQKTLESIDIRIVSRSNSLDEEFVKKLKMKVRKQMGGKIVMTVKLCDEIPIPASGKLRFTISDIT